MSKSLYERSLEALVEQLEAKVAKLEEENDVWRRYAGPIVDVDLAKQQIPPHRQTEAERVDEEAHLTRVHAAEVAAGFPLASEAHVTTPANAPMTWETEAHADPTPKRLSDAERRAVLLENGWTEHTEIYQQNIPICWERGAKWYSLEDAYGLVLKDREANLLLAGGWQPETGICGREFWKEPGTEELIPREYAVARLNALSELAAQ